MIIDHIRDIKEFKELYDSRPMPIEYDYDWLIKNPCLYCFYGEEKGERRKDRQRKKKASEKIFLPVSVRKNMPDNIAAIITVCNGFNEDMYSYTKVKSAILCLLKAGFKHLKNNKYVRYKTNG